MSDILRTSLAPVTEAAWKEIRSQAKRTLLGQMSARHFVDVEGPHGWEFAAVNIGRLRMGDGEPVAGVRWGIREVRPLIEVRVEFDLLVWELDNAARGARDLDLAPLLNAARKTALFEEQAVYNGFKEGGLEGMLTASPHKPITCKDDPEALVEALEHALVEIEKAGIGGPFGLVADSAVYERLMAGAQQGYPIRKRVEEFFGAGIRWSPAVQGAVVLSARGGDFVLTLGQDASIGYQRHDARQVTLFFTESFTFRVIEPAAAIAVKIKRG